jgi:hypothetical protein
VLPSHVLGRPIASPPTSPPRGRLRRWRLVAPALAIALGSGGLVIGVVQTAGAATSAGWASPVELTQPANAGANPEASFAFESCSSAGNCVAVGGYQDTAGFGQGATFIETGGNWAAGVEAPLPAAQATNPSLTFTGLSCASTSSCVAVGTYTDASAVTQGFLMTDASGTWTAIQPPVPANAAAAPNASPTSVSCSSPGNCVAVGDYQDNASHSQGLLLTESSGTWTATEFAAPSGAATNPSVQVLTLNCPSAGSCVAGGLYSTSGGAIEPLVFTESAGSWSGGVPVTLPSNSATNPQGYVQTLTCVFVGNCTGVGPYTNNAATAEAFTVTESSGNWGSTNAVAFPSNAKTGAGSDGNLDTISCISAGNCTVGGYYQDTSNNYQSVVVTEAAGNWGSTIELSLPSGAATASTSQDAFITGIFCTSAGNCIGNGSYIDSTGDGQTLQFTQSNSNLGTAVQQTLPANAITGATQSAFTATLGCATDGSCGEGGSYKDASGHIQGFANSYLPPVPTVTSISPSSGAAAASVTITGTGYFSGESVKFGSTAASSVTYNSGTSITAVAPSGTGTVDVTVGNVTGTSSTGTGDQFTYRPNAAPGPPAVTASSLGTPASATVVAGAVTTVSLTSGGASATVSVPVGALPVGTVVSLYPFSNPTALSNQVPPGQSFLIAFAVSWITPSGTAPAAALPITMTVTDAVIQAGDVLYGVNAQGFLVRVGTATTNGVATLTFSYDPSFVIAVTPKVTLAGSALGKLTKRAVQLHLNCQVGIACHGIATLSVARHKIVKKHKMMTHLVLATATVAIRANSTATVSFALTKAGKAILGHLNPKKRFRMTLTTSVTGALPQNVARPALVK